MDLSCSSKRTCVKGSDMLEKEIGRTNRTHRPRRFILGGGFPKFDISTFGFHFGDFHFIL